MMSKGDLYRRTKCTNVFDAHFGMLTFGMVVVVVG